MCAYLSRPHCSIVWSRLSTLKTFGAHCAYLCCLPHLCGAPFALALALSPVVLTPFVATGSGFSRGFSHRIDLMLSLCLCGWFWCSLRGAIDIRQMARRKVQYLEFSCWVPPHLTHPGSVYTQQAACSCVVLGGRKLVPPISSELLPSIRLPSPSHFFPQRLWKRLTK